MQYFFFKYTYVLSGPVGSVFGHEVTTGILLEFGEFTTPMEAYNDGIKKIGVLLKERFGALVNFHVIDMKRVE